jgi:hypothetical protein
MRRDGLVVQREGFFMRKSAFAIAVIAAACSSVAFAGEIKQDKKATAPVVKATTMSDDQMDKVTAGTPGNGNGHAWGRVPDAKGWEANTNFHGLAKGH